MGAGENLDQGRLAGAVVAKDAGHLPRVHIRGDVGQRDDISVAFGDVLHLQEWGRHSASSAFFLTKLLTRTASNRMTPTKRNLQSEFHPANGIPWNDMAMISAPSAPPAADP